MPNTQVQFIVLHTYHGLPLRVYLTRNVLILLTLSCLYINYSNGIPPLKLKNESFFTPRVSSNTAQITIIVTHQNWKGSYPQNQERLLIQGDFSPLGPSAPAEGTFFQVGIFM